MNTTATTSTRRPVARVLALLGGLLAALVVLVGPAPSASAATSYYTGVSFCAVQNDGGAYAGKPVTLMTWNGAGWVAYRNGTAGANGCGTFRYVDAGRFYYVRVNHVVRPPFCGGVGIIYSGISNYGSVGLNQTLNVGRVNVAVQYFNGC